jgi:urea carboxylase
VLRIGAIEGGIGQRAYLAVRDGFDVPRYMDSRSTFTLGQFGGHAGRALRNGDVLRIAAGSASDAGAAGRLRALSVPTGLRPAYTHDWDLLVLYGPHAAPDFFTADDIETLFATAWQVHYNSSRTGVRLIGPKPTWARRDGGEAGLHPSNIHDNAYAVGAIDFTGDMPVILGPDGPSLGGFVCPATIALVDLWKVGQFRPGDRVRFRPVNAQEARSCLRAQEEAICTLRAPERMPRSSANGDAGSRQAIL